MYLTKNKPINNIKKVFVLMFSLYLIFFTVTACEKTDVKTQPFHNEDKKTEAIKDEYKINPKNQEMKWEWFIEPGKYEDFYFADTDLIEIKDNNGKHGLIDLNKNIIIPFEYSEISSFYDGIAIVDKDNESYIINKKGEIIANISFESIGRFSEGYAAVKLNNKWGFIDRLGKMVIKNKFEEVNVFNEEYAAVKLNGKWGFVNKSGKIVIKNKFEEVKNFNEGYAAVKLNGKWGFVNKLGKFIIENKFEEVKDFNERYAAVKLNNKWGFIDGNGSICIDLKYDDVNNFSEGKAAVKLNNYFDDHLDAWAYIDFNGNVVIDFHFYTASEGRMIYVGDFKNGLAFVSNELYCIMDDKGKNFTLEYSSEFFIKSLEYDIKHDAIPAYVYEDDLMTIKKYGYVGLYGNQRLEPAFDYIYSLHGDYAVVEVIIDGEYKKGIIKVIDC